MKKFLPGIAAIAMLLMACGKDNKMPTSNYFSINGQSFSVTYGLLQNYRTDMGELWLSSIPLNDSVSGKVDLIYFEIDTLISGRTYTFYPEDSTGFDRTKYFSEAGYVYNGEIKRGEIDKSIGTVNLDIRSGKLTVSKQGDEYQFDYSLQFGNEQMVNGNYRGKISVTQ